jgi:hypothetical protein
MNKRPLVVFISDRPRGREVKQALAVKSQGWDAAILFASPPNYDLGKYFDVVRQYRTVEEALALADAYSPQVCHVHSLMSNGATAAAFIKHKPAPVVYDTNDTVRGSYTKKFAQSNPELLDLLWCEKYCLENADGICCRDLQVKYSSCVGQYKLPSNVLYFPEYCSEQEVIFGPKLSRGTDDIHVALVGNFGIEKKGEAEAGYLEIARLLADQGIHLHIYVHWFYQGKQILNDIFSDYIELSRSTPFIHIHESLPMDHVVPVLRQYDVGIVTVWNHLTGGEWLRWNPDSVRYGGPARVYDYLDAGLPSILHKKSLPYHMLARYGAAVDGSMDFFKNARCRLREFLNSGIQSSVKKAQASYSIYRHAERLVRFYEKVGDIPSQSHFPNQKKQLITAENYENSLDSYLSNMPLHE